LSFTVRPVTTSYQRNVSITTAKPLHHRASRATEQLSFTVWPVTTSYQRNVSITTTKPRSATNYAKPPHHQAVRAKPVNRALQRL
ncbi:Hypothetical predicted protein, partial [Olea europaea subsp. europaea]